MLRYFSKTFKRYQSTIRYLRRKKSEDLEWRSNELARLSNSSLLFKSKKSSGLITCVLKTRKQNEKFSNSFLPLTLDFLLRDAALRKIPNNNSKREMFMKNEDILISRLLDRSIRPLFYERATKELSALQIRCDILSCDDGDEIFIDTLNSLSFHLHREMNHLWNGPVGATNLYLYPNLSENEKYKYSWKKLNERHVMELTVASLTNGKILMINTKIKEAISDEDFLKYLEIAKDEAKCVAQLIVNECEEKGYGIKEKVKIDENSQKLMKEFCEKDVEQILLDSTLNKQSRDDNLKIVKSEIVEKINCIKEESLESSELSEYDDLFKLTDNELDEIFQNIIKLKLRELTLEKNQRCDGRSVTDVRPINCQVDIIPNVHGSALFQRGQTQVLATVAMDSFPTNVVTDEIGEKKNEDFFLHYEFPSYSTNEINRFSVGRPNRREIGHGTLAENGVRPMFISKFISLSSSTSPNKSIPSLPSENCAESTNYRFIDTESILIDEPKLEDENSQKLPVTTRVFCQVLESNGSSSMASVCAASMALLSSGNRLIEQVAGIAMGLFYENDDNYRILTDQMGMEDYFGDMDCKIIGTENSITNIQFDTKLSGVPFSIIKETIIQSKNGRSSILEKMKNTINSSTKSSVQPISKFLYIPTHLRSKFLGIGAYNLEKLKKIVKINSIDDNYWFLFADNQLQMDKCEDLVKDILKKEFNESILQFNTIYRGKIEEIRENGFMVSLFPQMPPTFLPNSQIDQRKVKHASYFGLKVGDEIDVKYFGRDPVNGQMRLSRKILQQIGGRSNNLFK